MDKIIIRTARDNGCLTTMLNVMVALVMDERYEGTDFCLKTVTDISGITEATMECGISYNSWLKIETFFNTFFPECTIKFIIG